MSAPRFLLAGLRRLSALRRLLILTAGLLRLFFLPCALLLLPAVLLLFFLLLLLLPILPLGVPRALLRLLLLFFELFDRGFQLFEVGQILFVQPQIVRGRVFRRRRAAPRERPEIQLPRGGELTLRGRELFQRRIELLLPHQIARSGDDRPPAVVLHRAEVEERLRPHPLVAVGVAQHRFEAPASAVAVPRFMALQPEVVKLRRRARAGDPAIGNLLRRTGRKQRAEHEQQRRRAPQRTLGQQQGRRERREGQPYEEAASLLWYFLFGFAVLRRGELRDPRRRRVVTGVGHRAPDVRAARFRGDPFEFVFGEDARDDLAVAAAPDVALRVGEFRRARRIAQPDDDQRNAAFFEFRDRPRTVAG